MSNLGALINASALYDLFHSSHVDIKLYVNTGVIIKIYEGTVPFSVSELFQ